MKCTSVLQVRQYMYCTYLDVFSQYIILWRAFVLGHLSCHLRFTLHTVWHVALHCSGNYQYTHPYKSGKTCGDCSKACNNKLCSECRQHLPSSFMSLITDVNIDLFPPAPPSSLSSAANPCPYTDKYTNCPELKQQHSCSNSNVASWCPASCKCTNQIIWTLGCPQRHVKQTWINEVSIEACVSQIFFFLIS